MTRNGRIILNVAATYGRSLYSLLLGLYTTRWVLQALGKVDFGLMGVVGGLAGFISIINALFAVAVGRFYAVNVGRTSVAEDKGAAMEETRKWFSTAVAVHTAVPTLLMLAGYPAGVWAVRHFLEIPPDRLADCVWVFRFVCIGSYLTMVSVPVQAMYTAKQYIAELTVYSFATTTLKAVGVYWMVTHPGVWLKEYALLICALTVLPQAIIALRGLWIFPECRFRWAYCASWERIRGLAYFVGWWAFGHLALLARGQGVQILINKYFGPEANGSMAIAMQVNAHTKDLSSAMYGAFQPAIVGAFGAGDMERMRALGYRACKFSMLFVLAFAIPLSLELREVLRLWLGSPPEYVYGLCLLLFAMTLADQSTVGHVLTVNACGKIARYQSCVGGILLSALPLGWLGCALGGGIYTIGWMLAGTMAACALGRVWFARGLAGMSALRWVRGIVAPVLLLAVGVACAGAAMRLVLAPSPWRVLATTVTCEAVLLPLAWIWVLDADERAYVKGYAVRFLKKLRGGTD